MGLSSASGVAIRFECSGHGNRSLILIHELGGGVHSWDGIVPLLEPDFRVLRYDQRGAGQSQKVSEPYTVEDQVRDLEAVIEAAGVEAPYTLVGVAAGSGVALLFAQRHAEEVSAVVFCCPSVGIDPDRRQYFINRSAQVAREGMGSVVDSTLAKSYPPEVIRDRAVFETYRGRFLENDPISYGMANNALVTANLESMVETLGCRCLVIAGYYDRLRTPSRVCAFAKRLQNFEFDVLDGGHLMPVQAPEALAKRMRAFLLSNESARPVKTLRDAQAGTHLIVEANDIRFHCRVDGPADAPCLLFINSLMTSLTLWDEQVKELEGRYRIIRYDQRGHGGTDVSDAPYTFDLLADDAVALLDLAAVERAVVIGVSMGAVTALRLAARYPDRIAAIVASDGQWAAPATAAAAWQERIDLADAGGMTALVEPTVQRWFTRPMLDTNPPVLDKVRQMIRDTPIDGFKRSVQALQQYDFRNDTVAIDRPVLLIVGKQDGTLPGVMKEMSLAINGSLYGEIEGAGHIPAVEQPDEFNQVMVEFLNSQLRATTVSLGRL